MVFADFLKFFGFFGFSGFFGIFSWGVRGFCKLKKRFKHWIAQYIPPKIVGFFGFFYDFWKFFSGVCEDCFEWTTPRYMITFGSILNWQVMTLLLFIVSNRVFFVHLLNHFDNKNLPKAASIQFGKKTPIVKIIRHLLMYPDLCIFPVSSFVLKFPMSWHLAPTWLLLWFA